MRTQLGQLIPSDRGILDHMPLYTVYKAERAEEGRGRHLEGWCLSSQVDVVHDGALLSWRWLKICLPIGICE